MESITLFGRTIQLTPEVQSRGVIIGCVVLGLLMFNSSAWPKIQEYMAMRATLDESRTALDNAKALTQTGPQIKARLKRVEDNLAALHGRFPPRNQVLSIMILDLAKIFKDTHNELVSFQPREFTNLPQESLKDLGKISVEVTAKGTYPSVILLFDQLSRYERVLTIEAPTLTPGEADSLNSNLTVTFTLTTYALSQ
ncbi:type 4a pilus biogenesis protein PilO [bacterium]|nr:type 4a pilus biogenesis protein PilO [bacterium]